MKISLIGAGKVAWHLAQALDKAENAVLEVYSRNIKNAEALCRKLYIAEPQNHLDFSSSNADLFILAIPDDAIAETLEQLLIPEKCILVHTSGSQGLDILFDYVGPKGVFYPLQTFSKEKPVRFENIPICIEASDAHTETQLETLAHSIAENVAVVDAEDRKRLHLAAVFACNFSNHLYVIAEQLLETQGLDFAILKPLVEETVEKAFSLGPKESQTGPASRQDMHTIQKHLTEISFDGSLQEVYRLMSERILKESR